MSFVVEKALQDHDGQAPSAARRRSSRLRIRGVLAVSRFRSNRHIVLANAAGPSRRRQTIAAYATPFATLKTAAMSAVPYYPAPQTSHRVWSALTPPPHNAPECARVFASDRPFHVGGTARAEGVKRTRPAEDVVTLSRGQKTLYKHWGIRTDVILPGCDRCISGEQREERIGKVYLGRHYFILFSS